MTKGRIDDQTHFTIHAFDQEGCELSLNPEPDDREHWVAFDVYEALALLSKVPAEGTIFWDEGDPEKVQVKEIRLMHSEFRPGKRGSKSAGINLIHTVRR